MSEQIEVGTATQPPRRKSDKITPEELASRLSEADLRNRIMSGNGKVQMIADEFHAAAQDVRNLMVQYFGDTVEFRRGRKGGVFFVTTDSENDE